MDDCKVYNLPPPTQGVASLLILGILNKLKHKCESEFNFIHSIVEATKKSFILRDKYVTDPDYMKIDINDLINDDLFSNLANEINLKKLWNGLSHPRKVTQFGWVRLINLEIQLVLFRVFLGIWIRHLPTRNWYYIAKSRSKFFFK